MPPDITRADIRALLRYLPLLRRPGEDGILRWDGGANTDDGALSLPHPVYADEVLAFFALAGQERWTDWNYQPAQARALLEDDAALASATLAQCVTMLTYCVRGERFCDGFWGALLRSGRLVALLDRLAALSAVLA
jgi:hypothetical protein